LEEYISATIGYGRKGIIANKRGCFLAKSCGWRKQECKTGYERSNASSHEC